MTTASTDDPAASPHPHRAIRSYVLRTGRMGKGSVKALQVLAPRYVLPYAEELLDVATAFGRQAPVVLEIGFGMGDATAAIAAAHPQIDFIGVEVHEPGVAALLRRIEVQQLSNLRLIRHDAVEVLRHMIAPDSLAGVHVYFPDPWHKKRHHKRRLIQPPLVALLASRLKPGCSLHCATDWQDYAEQMLQVLGDCPMLENTAAARAGAAAGIEAGVEAGTEAGADAASGFVQRTEMRPLTKFEQRGLKLGHGVWDLLFRRR